MPELLKALSKTDIIISWENMIGGQYSSLKNLLSFRKDLLERLDDLGYSNLKKPLLPY